MKYGFLRDICRGTYLGLLSAAWLGYLIGLRILNWNPGLFNNLFNIVGALLFTSLLYAFFGLISGLVFTFVIKLIFSIFSRKSRPDYFIRFWLTIYAAFTALLFTFLTITRTRPDAHVLIFDTTLVTIYILTLWLCFWYINIRISRNKNSVLKVSVIPIISYAVIGLLIAYFGTEKKEAPALGVPEQILEAYQSARSDVKVCVLGIDGAEWNIIDMLIAQGKMPVMEELLSKGSRLNFKSLETLKSPLIWTSMATGKTPDKHGIEDFGSFQFPLMKESFIKYPDGIGFYRLVDTFLKSADMPVNSTIRKVEAVWNLLSMAEKSVGVVGWWGTWPAETVNGIMVSDRFTYTLFNPLATANTLREGQIYPPELFDEVVKFVRTPNDMTNDELSIFIKGDVTGAVNQVWESSGREEWNPLYQLKLGYTSGETFFDVSDYILQKEQPDFFTVYLEGNDMVSHYFWQYYDPSVYPEKISQAEFDHFDEVMTRYYCYWDTLIGKTISELDSSTNIIVVSDHGFGNDPAPKTPFRGGEHRKNGIFLASGPLFKEGYNGDTASVIDLTPTILYLFGMPVAEDMDGKVIEQVIRDEVLEEYPMETIISYETGRRKRTGNTASSIDEAIKDQLRSLGYVK